MRTAAALIGMLLLSACASDDPVVTSTKYRVVIPEESMFACDTVERFPESRTLTDLQVARLLVELHQNNVRCRNSVQAIRQFLEDSRTRIETGKEPSPQSAPQRRVPIRP
jgi:hypothetical protein